MNELWQNEPDIKLKESIGASYFEKQKQQKFSYLFDFTKNQINNKLPEDFDETKHNITIYNSSLYEYYSFDDFRSIFFDQVNTIIKILEEFKNDNNYIFYLRVHPNLTKARGLTQMNEIEELSKRNYPNLKIIEPDSSVDSYALLLNLEKVIVFTSTVGIEACYLNKPSILLGKAYYEDIDVTYNPNSFEEVYDLIKSDLKPKDKKNTYKYGYYYLKRDIDFKYFDPFDYGGSFLGYSISTKEKINKNVEYKYKFKNRILKEIERSIYKTNLFFKKLIMCKI
jgi:capsule polysaccharide export protein KpsC/LpsZ